VSLQEKLTALWDRLKGKGPAAAVALNLDLGEARENKPIMLEAGGLLVEKCTGDLYARINGPNGDGFDLRYTKKILYPISALYLTNAAQPYQTARLLLLPTGMDADPPTGEFAFILGTRAAVTVNAGDETYHSVFGDAALVSEMVNIQLPMFRCTIRALKVRSIVNTQDDACSIFVYRNGSTTLLSVNVPAGQTGFFTTEQEVDFSENDRLNIAVINWLPIVGSIRMTWAVSGYTKLP